MMSAMCRSLSVQLNFSSPAATGRSSRVSDLPALKKDARFVSTWAGELERGAGSAHAFQLNDVGDVQIAQRPTKFFFAGRDGPEQSRVGPARAQKRRALCLHVGW